MLGGAAGLGENLVFGEIMLEFYSLFLLFLDDSDEIRYGFDGGRFGLGDFDRCCLPRLLKSGCLGETLFSLIDES